MNLIALVSTIRHSQVLNAAVWGCLGAFLLSMAVVYTKRWHGKLTLDGTQGIQKVHLTPTPRVGGVPIMLAAILAWYLAPSAIQVLLGPILLAGAPAFLFGLTEDLTKQVSVLQRLLATMGSGILAWLLTGLVISRVNVPGADLLLTFLPLAVAFTAFAVGGVTNAINIIDGFNGLASSTAAWAFLGYAGIAWQVADPALAGAALILAACVFGFFAVNWPLGKLFLGDGGSYFVGFALAWVAVLLMARHPNVSAFGALLVCALPITEVLFTIYRRKMRQQHPGQPDRLHFHSLLQRRYVARWLRFRSSTWRNSVSGILVGSVTLIAAVLSNVTFASTSLSALVLFAWVLVYVALYARMVRHRWCSPITFLLLKPRAA